MTKSLSTLYLFVFYFSPACINANDAEQNFQSGNRSFQQKNYSEAIQHYQAVLQDGQISAALFSNMGNAYFQQKEYAKAILYYQRALMLLPADEILEADLLVCRRAAGIEIRTEGAIFRTIKNISGALPPNAWAVISFIFMWGTAYCCGMIFLKKQSNFSKIKPLNLLTILLIFNGLVNILAWQSSRIRQFSELGVVMQNSKAYPSPDASTDVLDEIRAGESVALIEHLGNWWKVSLPDGGVAWMIDSAIEKVDFHN